MGWGDELMVTGHARVLQQADPRRVRPVYERPRDHEAWQNNPRIAGKHERGDFQEYVARVDGLRPYMVAKRDDRYAWKPYQPPVGELFFSEKELAFGARFAGRIVIEPSLKGGASPNKDWGWERWQELATLMVAHGLQPTQVGPAETRLLRGVEFVHTNSMRYAAAVLAGARAAVLPEGGLHHVAAAVGCAAVVLYGGFITPAVTGYAGQVGLFHATSEHPLGCGWRRSCRHCADAMAQFPPAKVHEALQQLLARESA